MAFTYEFQCAHCGEIFAVQGREAANRRNSKKYKKNPDLDFCTLRCSSKFMHSPKNFYKTEVPDDKL